MSVPQITIFDALPSSYCMKVRIALREKKLPFSQIMPVGDPAQAEAFAAANPRREVPCLIHSVAPDPSSTDNATNPPVTIFDSTVICEYLEDAFPNTPSTLPPLTDPAARARVRILEDVADTQYEGLNWGWGEVFMMGRAGEPGSELYEHLKSEAKRQTAEIHAWLETQLPASGAGEFFGGNVFSVADIALFTVVNRSRYYGWLPPAGSRLEKWLAAVDARDSVKETRQEFDSGIGKLAASKEAFQTGKRQRQYRDNRLEWLIKTGAMSVVEEGIKKNNVRFSWPEGKLPGQK